MYGLRRIVELICSIDELRFHIVIAKKNNKLKYFQIISISNTFLLKSILNYNYLSYLFLLNEFSSN